MATTMTIHPTWERDFIKGLLHRVLLNKELSTSPSSSSSTNKQPYIVGLVGMPGSGKVRYIIRRIIFVVGVGVVVTVVPIILLFCYDYLISTTFFYIPLINNDILEWKKKLCVLFIDDIRKDFV